MAKKKKKKGDDEKLKKRKRVRDDDYDDEDDDLPDEDDDPTVPKRRQDVFVGLAFLSLAFLITASVFFYQDNEEIELKKFGAPTVQVDGLTAVGDKVK